MALFPEFPVVGVASDKTIPSRTYRVDWEKGRIAGTIDKEDAIRQAIYKIIRTPRFHCLAYDDQYGSEIEALIGTQALTREYVESEMLAMVKDALLEDGRISAIEDVDYSLQGDELDLSFTAVTSYGDTNVNIKGVI